MMTSTAKPDYWSLLGISPGSNPDQVKMAFRREARRWHPDLNGNDLHAEERFKLVNEAYAVLSDPRKRSAWEGSFQNLKQTPDQFAHGFPTFETYLSTVLGVNLPKDETEDYDQPIDNQAPWPTKSSTPPSPVQAFENIESTVDLTPDQALNGTIVELELEDGTLIELDTPPLAGDGWRLRLAGVAKGGRDHFLQLRVETEEGLRIDGLRVLYRLELFPADAVLGCAVEVPTLGGPVTLQVPPGSSSGRLLRLRGRGMEYEGRRGDQLVEINVVFPAQLTESEQALYKRLQELSSDPEAI